jgi:hypothetical protein
MPSAIPLLSRRKQFTLLLLTISTIVHPASLPTAENGTLDARKIMLDEVRLPLNGQWLYFENQLLLPEEVQDLRGAPVVFPKTWNEEGKSGVGFGTYSLKILPPSNIPALALEIPQLYSSYELWANGKLIASNGKVGRTAETSIPQWRPQTVAVENSGDTLRLVLRISNFQHHTGGVREPLYLGSDRLLQQHRAWSEGSNRIEILTLFILGLVFLFVYALKGKKKVALYFALLCFTWSVRSAFSNLYLAVWLMPEVNWNTMVRTEYISLYLTMIWAILFLSKLFEREGNAILKYLFVTGNAGFTLYTLLATPMSFSRWLPVYLTISAALLVYTAYVILWAIINERVGARTLLTGLLLGLVIFGYDLLTYQEFFSYNPVVFNAGYVAIFLVITVALLLHLDIIKGKPKASGMLRYDDLYK